MAAGLIVGLLLSVQQGAPSRRLQGALQALLKLEQPRLSSMGDRGPGSNDSIFRIIKQPLAKGSFLPFNVLKDLPRNLGALRAQLLSDLCNIKCHHPHLSTC